MYYNRRFITAILITTLTVTPLVGLAKTYTGNQLLTSAIKSSGTLVWNIKTKFKKQATFTKKLVANAAVTLGNAVTDVITINGTISSTEGSVDIDDDVHITGQLDLDQPLQSGDLPTSGIVTALTAGSNVTLTDNGSGSYTIASTDTDTDTDTNTTYTAGTGLSLTGTSFASTLGTSIASSELDASAVDAAALASTAIQSGDIESGDLPSDGYASTYANDDGDTLTGTFGIDGAVFTSNGVPRQLVGASQIPKTSTTTSVDSTDTVGQYSSITIGIDGMPVVSYYDTTNGNLKVLKCSTITCSSSSATAVDSTGDVGQYTSIIIGTDGFPVISYYDVTNGNLKVIKCGNAACSSGNTTSIVDSSSNDVGKYSSIAIGTDGFPVISYHDNTDDDLEVAKCSTVSCSASTTVTVDDTSANTGLYTSITIGTDGFPVISYEDSTGGDLEVAKCGNASCSASNILTTVDSLKGASGGSFGSTSIAIGTDGFPVISYFDSTAGGSDLEVAKCSTVSCSTSTLSTVDNTAATLVGEYSSITIGTDGFPVISYYDGTNFDLKIAKCGTASCSSATLKTVDSTETTDVDLYTSITIGVDGNPVVAYYDLTNSGLKVYKAANPFNVDYWNRR